MSALITWKVKKSSVCLSHWIQLLILKFKKYTHINRCSEIAAFVYVKKFLNLDTLPNHYDFESLIKNKKMTPSDLKSLEADYQIYV